MKKLQKRQTKYDDREIVFGRPEAVGYPSNIAIDIPKTNPLPYLENTIHRTQNQDNHNSRTCNQPSFAMELIERTEWPYVFE